MDLQEGNPDPEPHSPVDVPDDDVDDGDGAMSRAASDDAAAETSPPTRRAR